MRPSTFCAVLAVLVSCFVCVARGNSGIPIMVRSCSLCRMYGSVRSCSPVTRSHIQCNGLFVDSIATCVRKAGFYSTEPKLGCYMV